MTGEDLLMQAQKLLFPTTKTLARELGLKKIRVNAICLD